MNLCSTLLVKVVTLPLTTSQLESTTKMQKLTPLQKRIQERYVDDETTKNKMLSQLFQAANVNPLAGCFPALIQIPIFISLYRALQNLIAENKLDEPFLWIPDLNGPVYAKPPGESLDWAKSIITGKVKDKLKIGVEVGFELGLNIGLGLGFGLEIGLQINDLLLFSYPPRVILYYKDFFASLIFFFVNVFYIPSSYLSYSITFLFPLLFFTGNPELGWHDTLAFLTLPLILYASQSFSSKGSFSYNSCFFIFSNERKCCMKFINNCSPLFISYYNCSH
jgi:hypothetical protein